MSTKLRQIIIIEDSNLANATKKEYGYRLKQFFHDSTIKSYEELKELKETILPSASDFIQKHDKKIQEKKEKEKQKE